MFSKSTRLLVAATLVCGWIGSGASAATTEATYAGGWARPAVLAPHGLATDVAVAGNGDMAVAISDAGDLAVVRRTSGGDWGAPTRLVRRGVVEDPTVEYDGAGRLWVAWLDNHRTARVLARHTRARGGGWSPTEVVAARGRGAFTGLQLELSARGRAMAAWRWIYLPRLGNGLLLLAERSGAGAWDQTGSFGEVWDFDLALGDSGRAAVMMGRLDAAGSTETVTVARRPAGESWEVPQVMATISDSDRLVGLGSVGVDAAGTTTAVWRDKAADGAWEVFAARAEALGNWGAHVRVGRRAAEVLDAPAQVRTTPDGATLVLWNRRDYSLVAARNVDGAWTNPVRVSGKNAFYWSIALDPGGRAVAVWSRGGRSQETGHGIVASLMNRRGDWSSPRDVAARASLVLRPLAAMSHGDALAVWWYVTDERDQVRGSTHPRS